MINKAGETILGYYSAMASAGSLDAGPEVTREAIENRVTREFDATVKKCELEVWRQRLAFYTKARISAEFNHEKLDVIDFNIMGALRQIAKLEL